MVRNELLALRGLIDDRLQSLATKAGWLASIKLTSLFLRAEITTLALAPSPSMVADLVLGCVESIITCDEFTTAFQKIDNRIHVHTGC